MKRGFNILGSLLRALILQLSAILAISLAMYFPGLDLILGFCYLYLVWKEAIYCRQRCSRAGIAAVAVLWQLPGYFLAGSILLSLDVVSQFAYYFIFILELWDTPLLPFISLLPVWTWLDRPFYYYFLFLIPPLMSFYYYFPALKKQSKIRSAGSI